MVETIGMAEQGREQENDGEAAQTARAVHLRLVLWRAAKAVDAFDSQSIASTGLGRSDFAVLEALLHRGAQPVNVLGRRVLLTSGSISTAVARLEEKGLVCRKANPEDRRVCVIDLTGDGHDLISGAFETHAQNLDRAMAVLEADEKEELIGLLKKLGKGVSHRTEEAA